MMNRNEKHELPHELRNFENRLRQSRPARSDLPEPPSLVTALRPAPPLSLASSGWSMFLCGCLIGVVMGAGITGWNLSSVTTGSSQAAKHESSGPPFQPRPETGVQETTASDPANDRASDVTTDPPITYAAKPVDLGQSLMGFSRKGRIEAFTQQASPLPLRVGSDIPLTWNDEWSNRSVPPIAAWVPAIGLFPNDPRDSQRTLTPRSNFPLRDTSFTPQG